jgi:GDPmannose 4,6-dehydratase
VIDESTVDLPRFGGQLRAWVRVARDGRTLVEIDPRYFRPTEVDVLLGDPVKAQTKLGWHHKVTFEALVREMVEADLVAVKLEIARRSRHE